MVTRNLGVNERGRYLHCLDVTRSKIVDRSTKFCWNTMERAQALAEKFSFYIFDEKNFAMK